MNGLLASSFVAAPAHAVDVQWTTFNTLLRVRGDTNLDQMEADDRFRFPRLIGSNWSRSEEHSNGRASGRVTADVSGGGTEAVTGTVELQATGQWEVASGSFDESRADYAISFLAPSAIEIRLEGLLAATQTSQTRIFVDAFDDGRYWEPFEVTDDPFFTSRTIRPGDPPDSKTIDETIVLPGLTTPEGTYRLYFSTYGDPFNALAQEAFLNVAFSIRAIPEPGTATLLGLGIAGLAGHRRRPADRR